MCNRRHNGSSRSAMESIFFAANLRNLAWKPRAQEIRRPVELASERAPIPGYACLCGSGYSLRGDQ